MKKFFTDILSVLTPREKSRFWWLIAADVLMTLLDLIFLGLLLLVVGYYTQTLDLERIPGEVVRFAAGHPLLLIGSFLLLFALKNFGGFIVFRNQYRFVYGVASRLAHRQLERYLQGPYRDFVNTDSSVHTRRISNETIEFSHHVLRGAQQITSNAIMVALTVITIIFFDATLFGMLLLMLLPAVVLLSFFTRKKLVRIREAAGRERERSIQFLNEALAGYVESNVYQKADFFSNRYATAQQRFNTGLAGQVVMQNLPTRFMEVFAVFGLFLLVVIQTYILQSESFLLLIGAFMAAAYKIIPGIVRILNHLQQVRIFYPSLQALKNETGVAAENPPDPPSSLKSIELDKVTFCYEDRPVISNVSLRIEAGFLTGLSAPSGTGKSTLINLILGFLEPTSGAIYINEYKSPDTERRSYWPKVSYARQQSFLLHDTIQHNITLDTTPDMKKLWQALNEAGLTDFVAQSEKGLDTIITEAGKNISGGQRQRLMMARAFYRDADFYILDEPFSELDRESVAQMLSRLKSLCAEGKMVLLITHDAEALRSCDKLIRLYEK